MRTCLEKIQEWEAFAAEATFESVMSPGVKPRAPDLCWPTQHRPATPGAAAPMRAQKKTHASATLEWFPNRDSQTINLHERICSGKEEAGESVALLLFESLIRWLSSQFPQIDCGIIADGVSDAIMSYLQHPARFDPTRAGLKTFLRCVAWRNVRAILHREKRRKRREAEALGEHHCQICRTSADGTDEAEAGEQEAIWQTRRERFEQFLCTLDETDRRVMELWIAGERRSGAFAEVLGIGQLLANEQHSSVYRVKKRLRMAAKRWMTPHI